MVTFDPQWLIMSLLNDLENSVYSSKNLIRFLLRIKHKLEEGKGFTKNEICIKIVLLL